MCGVYRQAFFLVKAVSRLAKHGFATTRLCQNDRPGSGNTLTLW